MDTEEYEETVESIKAIEANVIKKGKNHWYDSTGKLIINGNNEAFTQKKLIEIIKKSKKKYMDTKICHINVDFYYDQDLFLEKTMGPLEIQAVVYEVRDVLGRIKLQMTHEKGTLIRMFYSLKDMNKFEIAHMKKIAQLALDGKLKTTLLKYYHYKDLKKQLD